MNMSTRCWPSKGWLCTIGHNYNCPWAESCLATIRVGARMYLGIVMYGLNRVVFGHNRVWEQSCLAQSCIIATNSTKCTSLFWYEMSLFLMYATFFNLKFFFQIKKRYKPEKRTVKRHKWGYTTSKFSFPRINKLMFKCCWSSQTDTNRKLLYYEHYESIAIYSRLSSCGHWAQLLGLGTIVGHRATCAIVSGHNCVWVRLCLGTIVSGYNCVWVQLCLGTIVSGHNCVWAQLCLGTIVSGHNCVWVQLCLGTIVSGYNCVWVQLCLGTIVSGYNCVWVQLCLGTIVSGYNCVWVQLCLDTVVSLSLQLPFISKCWHWPAIW